MTTDRPTISDLAKQFVAWKLSTCSKNTADAYQTALRVFEQYLDKRGITSPNGLTVGVLEDFVVWLTQTWKTKQGNKIAPSTRVVYLTAVKLFVNRLFIHEHLVMSHREMEAWRDSYKEAMKGKPSYHPHPLKQEVVEELTAAARRLPVKDERDELIRLRDIAIIETLRTTGMRVGELCSLKRGNLRDMVATVQGKGTKKRDVFFDKQAWRALQSYLRHRDVHIEVSRDEPSQPVFSRHDKGAGDKVLPLSTNAVRNVLAKIRTLASVDTGLVITPHRFRHTFATRIQDTTGNLAVTQKLLGHASPITTEIYAEVNIEALRQAHEVTFEKH